MSEVAGSTLAKLNRFAPTATMVAVVGIVLGVASAQPAGVFWDDGVYLITARSIAEGYGYRYMHLPGGPSAVHFPPGWPFLLSLLWRVAPDFPANLKWFRLLNYLLAAGGATLACVYGIKRLRLTPLLAAGAAILFAATLPVLVLDSVLFSEPTFLLLAVATLFLADVAEERNDWRLVVASGAFAGATALTRSTGLMLVPAVVGALLIARRWRHAALAAAATLVAILPWQLWSSSATASLAEPLRGSYGPYFPWLMAAVRERGIPFVVAIARQNVVAFERTLSVIFFPVGVQAVRPLLVAFLVVVTALGIAEAWRRSRTLCLFLATYAALVCVWPYSPDRFAWALWPLAGMVLALGAAAAWRIGTQAANTAGVRVAAATLCATAALAAMGIAFYSARGVSRGWVDVAQRRNATHLAPVVEWVNAHTPLNAVVACDGDPLVHLYTGRRVLPVHVLSPDEYLAGTPLQQAADDLAALVRAGHATYAVFSGGSGEIEAVPLIAQTPGAPRLVQVDTLRGGGAAFRVEWPQ